MYATTSVLLEALRARGSKAVGHSQVRALSETSGRSANVATGQSLGRGSGLPRQRPTEVMPGTDRRLENALNERPSASLRQRKALIVQEKAPWPRTHTFQPIGNVFPEGSHSSEMAT